jgi:uncharacterized membrane protein
MDWYVLLKTLHVTAAVLWVGGGFLGLMLGVQAERSRDTGQLIAVVGQLGWCADRVFVPAGIGTLITGIATTWVGGLWSESWVWLGLAGIATTIGMGMGVLGPRVASAVALAKAGELDRAASMVRKVLALARFDAVMLLAVVAVMVLKPSFTDWPVLTLIGTAIAAVGALSLPRALQSA